MGIKELSEKLFPRTTVDEYDFDNGVENEGYEEQEAPVRPAEKSYGARGGVNVISGASIEMKVVTPKSYDTVTQIADLLLQKKTVLLNLENTNRETARRLIDFLSGSAYALGGGVQKVADNTYAITPNNVEVSSESVGGVAPAAETESNGLGF